MLPAKMALDSLPSAWRDQENTSADFIMLTAKGDEASRNSRRGTRRGMITCQAVQPP